jgi:hypothetical protein
MKLAYPIDTMLQVEVVGGTPSGAVVAVELRPGRRGRWFGCQSWL